jgi:hypothetical protein
MYFCDSCVAGRPRFSVVLAGLPRWAHCFALLQVLYYTAEAGL